MRPTLLEIDVLGAQVTLGAYRTLLVAGAMLAVALLLALAHRRGLPLGRVVVFTLATAAAIPVGARLLHFATNPGVYADDPRSCGLSHSRTTRSTVG